MNFCRFQVKIWFQNRRSNLRRQTASTSEKTGSTFVELCPPATAECDSASSFKQCGEYFTSALTTGSTSSQNDPHRGHGQFISTCFEPCFQARNLADLHAPWPEGEWSNVQPLLYSEPPKCPGSSLKQAGEPGFQPYCDEVVSYGASHRFQSDRHSSLSESYISRPSPHMTDYGSRFPWSDGSNDLQCLQAIPNSRLHHPIEEENAIIRDGQQTYLTLDQPDGLIQDGQINRVPNCMLYSDGIQSQPANILPNEGDIITQNGFVPGIDVWIQTSLGTNETTF